MTAVEYYPRVCIKYSLLFLLYWISSGNYVVEGGKAKSKGQEINGVQSVNEHIAVLETEDVLTQNYQGAVFIYPPGVSDISIDIYFMIVLVTKLELFYQNRFEVSEIFLYVQTKHLRSMKKMQRKKS